MIVGLLSDTHGRFDTAQAGVRTLLEAGAETLIHCGDVGGPEILDLLAGVPSYFVFGNNDWDRAELANHAKLLGVTCLDNYGEIELADHRAAVTHGDNASLMRRATGSAKISFLFHGHTHIPSDETFGSVRVINPGALHRANPKTVALLDTASGKLAILRVTI